MTQEIRKLKLYYSKKIHSLRKEIDDLRTEIVTLNNVIQDKDYGLPE